MGTTHNHDLPAAATLAATDQYPAINATTGRGAYVTGAQLRGFVAGDMTTVTATGAVTAAAHGGRTMLLGEVGGDAAVTVTLPAATGTGNKYRFVVSVVNTSNYVVAALTTDVLKGVVVMLDNDSNAVTGYAASGTDDKITLNGTTTGGQIGDWLEFQDILSGTWHVSGALMVPAGSNVADPFSAT